MKYLTAAIGLAALADPSCRITSSGEPKRFSGKSRTLFGEPKRELKEFSIKGHRVMAYSKKDAITRLKHQKKI